MSMHEETFQSLRTKNKLTYNNYCHPRPRSNPSVRSLRDFRKRPTTSRVWLTHDSQSVRKAHNAGRAHLQNVQDYYARVAQEEAQKRLSEMSSSGLKQKENGTLNLPHVFAFPPKPVYTGFALPPPPLIIPSTMYTSAPQIPQAAAAPLAAAAAQTLPTAPSRANAAQSQQQRPNRHRPNGHRPMHLSRN
ncbi:U1 snRNP-associated protein Usp103 [Schizosaccharomyces japonicus yFS275]|uniref:U1 snRNP-associated protein Usp103 n=1 Tax=Schizosaccharomyces japonicus (strain yFS275 / FY16936) TaxID=402676 RepID=B6K5K8_SCHJY|nr:U1 snRNP-associated protein Usp103 [Schizosaccharomyces japonicus yFS275]EEB08812.1 U1 snRNP-associated protein Usp103 [Schizosaccharomyces japonicus yFS275]